MVQFHRNPLLVWSCKDMSICLSFPQITVHRGDECALLNNSLPFKWRVLNDKGSEASVPSICFVVPPTNKEAVNSVAG